MDRRNIPGVLFSLSALLASLVWVGILCYCNVAFSFVPLDTSLRNWVLLSGSSLGIGSGTFSRCFVL